MGEVPLEQVDAGWLKRGVKIKYHREGAELQDRPVIATCLTTCEPLVPYKLPQPDSQASVNIEMGATKRFLRKPPLADPATMRRFRRFVQKWVRAWIEPISPDTDLSFDAWLPRTKYAEGRKEELRLALSEFECGLRLNNHGIGSFQKREPYLTYKHARAINARCDVDKCIAGPVFKAMEDIVYKHPSFIKHVPVVERATYIRDWLQRPGSKYLASDYEAFESLFTVELMRSCEFVLYEHMVSALPEAREIMAYLRSLLLKRNVCRFRDFVATVDGTRMSGEMNTSLGNGFTNLMACLFLCEEAGASDVRMVVEGDDGLASLEGPFPTPADFERLGLRIKVCVEENLGDASFCGLIFDEDEKVSISDARKHLCEVSWGDPQYHLARPSKKLGLLRAKGYSLAYQFAGCPILQELGHTILRLTRSVDVRWYLKTKNCGWWQRTQLMAALEAPLVYREIGIGTRLLMERTFGIPLETQVHWEETMRSMSALTALNLGLLEDVCPVEWLDFANNYIRPCRHMKSSDFWVDPAHLRRCGHTIVADGTNTPAT